MDTLPAFADLMRRRNAIDAQIAALMNRPVHSGHLGEYVASAIFDIALHADARAKVSDGYFRRGLLAGRSVNVKYATKRDGNLNLGASLDPSDHSNFYLVLTGPKVAAGSSRGRR